MNTFKKLISMLFLFTVLFSMAACNKNNGIDSNSTVDLKERTGKPLTQEELNKIMPPSFFEDPDGDGLLASNPQWIMAKTMQTQRLSSRVLPAIRAGVGSGKKILFHTRINAQWVAFTSSLHQLLADNGYEVVIHADDTPLTASDVADIDVLAITNTLGSPDPETGIDRPLSFDEKNLIKNFVASGKGFFFTGDWVNYNLPEFNDVSQMFGITFALQYIDYIPIVEDGFITYYWVPEWYAAMFDVYSYYIVSPFQPIMRKAPFNGYSWFVNPDHGIFKDVNRILLMGASFINPKEFGVAAVQTHSITGRPRDWPISADSSYPVITALEHGSGRVVISGDTNCFGNDGFATSVTAGTDNQKFASNVFNWLAKATSEDSLKIISPPGGSQFSFGEVISFVGSQTGSVSNIQWTSSLDGSFGSGSLSIATSGLRIGTHTITLSGQSSDGQSLSDSITVAVQPFLIEINFNPEEVRPTGTTDAVPTTVTVTVTSNGQPVPNHPVNAIATTVADSGGHLHDGDRPIGAFQNAAGLTGVDGVFTTTYTPSQFGGTETIIISSTVYPNASNSRDLTVRFPNLLLLPDENYYIQVGGTVAHPGPNDQGHPTQPNTDHWGTQGLIDSIQGLSHDYNASFTAGPLLAFNDMSLPNGGRFDINGNWGGDHQTHREGKNVDFRVSHLTAAQRDWIWDFGMEPHFTEVLEEGLGEGNWHWHFTD